VARGKQQANAAASVGGIRVVAGAAAWWYRRLVGGGGSGGSVPGGRWRWGGGWWCGGVNNGRQAVAVRCSVQKAVEAGVCGRTGRQVHAGMAAEIYPMCSRI